MLSKTGRRSDRTPFPRANVVQKMGPRCVSKLDGRSWPLVEVSLFRRGKAALPGEVSAAYVNEGGTGVGVSGWSMFHVQCKSGDLKKNVPCTAARRIAELKSRPRIS